MNTCCSPALNAASPAPARPAAPLLPRLVRLLGPMAVDLTNFLFVDEPRADLRPRATFTEYR